jgi:hypothetical protein
MPGRHQSESVADINPERPAEIIGIRTLVGAGHLPDLRPYERDGPQARS